MKKKLLVIFIGLVIIACLLLMTLRLFDKNENKEESRPDYGFNPSVYEVCDEDSCIYLLGTMHLGGPEMKGLSDNIWYAYDHSDALAVELDITVPSDASSNINLYLDDGDDISNYLSEEDMDTLTKILKKHIIPIDAVRNYNLLAMSQVLELLLYTDLGLVNDNGVDIQLLNKAHQDNKTIIPLEKEEDQLSILYDRSDDFYKRNVHEILVQYDLAKESVNFSYLAYISGNILMKQVAYQYSLSDKDEEVNEYNLELLEKRNQYMIERAKEFLSNNDSVLYAVGDAHISGENGLLTYFRKNGYKVTLVK